MTASHATATAPSPRRLIFIFTTDLVSPVILYYVLRAVGLGVYAALLASAAVPASLALWRFIRDRHADGIATYTASVMIAGAAVSLIDGDPRFLLAREGWLTMGTGLWFLASLRLRARPLAYSFSRPFLQRRLIRRCVPEDWDLLWERLSGFRRIWRISTVLWGIGLIADATVRVVIAYSLPVDAVPALSAPLYAATSVILLVVTNLYYRSAGLFDGDSPLYAPLSAAPDRKAKGTDDHQTHTHALRPYLPAPGLAPPDPASRTDRDYRRRRVHNFRSGTR